MKLFYLMLAFYSINSYASDVDKAMVSPNLATTLPRLYAKGLSNEHRLLHKCPEALPRIAAVLDILAANGVTRKGIEPWSKLIGGDGNRLRYEREMNVFGIYLA